MCSSPALSFGAVCQLASLSWNKFLGLQVKMLLQVQQKCNPYKLPNPCKLPSPVCIIINEVTPIKLRNVNSDMLGNNMYDTM